MAIARNNLRRCKESALMAKEPALAKMKQVDDITGSHLNTIGRQKKQAAASTLIKAMNSISLAENSSKLDALKGVAEYDKATGLFLEVINTCDETLTDGVKHPGRIRALSWSIRVHNEDKEKQVHMAIRVTGAKAMNPGTNEHWSNKTDHPGPDRTMSKVDDINISIENNVELSVGIENEKDERNCRVDAEFWVTLHCEDESGKKWDSVHHYDNTQWSTNDKGLGASDIRTVATINRYESFMD